MKKKNLKILNPTEISGEIHLTWSEKKKRPGQVVEQNHFQKSC